VEIGSLLWNPEIQKGNKMKSKVSKFVKEKIIFSQSFDIHFGGGRVLRGIKTAT
jgi:hypothetical protein